MAVSVPSQPPPVAVRARFPKTVEARRPLVSVTGTVAGGRATTVQLREARGGASPVRARALVRNRRFSVAWSAPRVPATVVLRVAALRGGRVVGITPRHSVVVKPVVARVRDRKVMSAPAPDAPSGRIEVDGRSRAKPGDVVGMGVTKRTPNGYLGVVDGVTRSGGRTFLSVHPISLLKARANGDLNVAVDFPRLEGEGSGPCSGGAPASAHGSVRVTPKARFEAHWRRGRVVSARLSGAVRAEADLAASAGTRVDCTIGPTAIRERTLRPITRLVGPIPVVIVPKISLEVAGSATARSDVSAALHGSAIATGEVKYAGGHVALPALHVTPAWAHDTPIFGSTGTLEAEVGPALELLLYDVAGPKLALRTGLELEVVKGHPAWTLRAPVRVDASFEVPKLRIDASRTLYQHDLTVAKATDRPSVATIVWNTDKTDVDLHVWDAAGKHASYRAPRAVPGASLSADDLYGFGPEHLYGRPSGRKLGYGLCYFVDHHEGNRAAPTTVTARWVDELGRHRSKVVKLGRTGATAAFGATELVPARGWCR
jgi:hypothetical protein